MRPRKLREGQPAWRFEEPKTRRSRRTVVLEQEVVNLLADHRARQDDEKAAAGSAYEDIGLVFCDELGRPLRQDSLARNNFKRILRRAGLPEQLSPYSLRHAAATALLKKRESLKIVSEMLGHASIRLTADTYSHVCHDMLAQAASKLDEVMFGPRDPDS